MKGILEYRTNYSSVQNIIDHLNECDKQFIPPLSDRVSIAAYANKLVTCASRFEVWQDTRLIAMLALYANDSTQQSAFITSVSVLDSFAGRGIAKCLIGQAIDYSKQQGLEQIMLEVGGDNYKAIGLYHSLGFHNGRVLEELMEMSLKLTGGNDER